MNRREFEHVIRACADATGGHGFLVIGSQSILGSVPDAPRELRASMELDVCPLPFTEPAAALIDSQIQNRTGDCKAAVEMALATRRTAGPRRKNPFVTCGGSGPPRDRLSTPKR